LSSILHQGIVLPAMAATSRAAEPARHSMTGGDRDHDAERARRFREAALPHLDAVYTLARYLLRDANDAEDAVQECYLRALKHFDSYRGPQVKPWLFAILRNVCHAEFARRTNTTVSPAADIAQDEQATPLWHEVPDTPEDTLLRHRDSSSVQRLVAALAEPFRETFVLREVHDLSYREIAELVGAPVGTVMSRLARARAMLRAAWMEEERPK
jgi:RNA polymerase sigma-70 factor, ECF subfamily